MISGFNAATIYGYGNILELLTTTNVKTINYRYYKFLPTLLRSTGSNSVQFSELSLRNSGVRVNYTNAVATNPGGSNPGGETPNYAIDNNVNTKFLDFNKGPLVIDFTRNTLITEYTFATANDGSDRDPISWQFYGSNDNSTWVLLDTQTNYATTQARYTYQNYFTITPV